MNPNPDLMKPSAGPYAPPAVDSRVYVEPKPIQRLMGIGVFSFAKVMGLAATLVTFVIMIPYALIMVALSSAFGGANENVAGGAAFGIGMALAMMIIGPILYGIFGFIFGLIYGAIFNLALRWSGGLEMDIR